MATIEEHGVGVALKRTKKRLFIEVVMVGKLTHEDYQTFVPVIDKALKTAKGLEVDLLIDMRAFKGWKPKAAWDDAVFGFKHRTAFDKTAVVGNKKWEELSVKLFAPLMKGKVKFFKTKEKALAWLMKRA